MGTIRKFKPKQRLTPEDWIELAEQFEIASHALMENRSDMLDMLGRAHIALRAFGLECYLKCLVGLGS